MPLTFLELRTEVEAELSRNGHTRFPEDQLKHWVSEATSWLCRKHPALWFWLTEDVATWANIPASTTHLYAPSDFRVMKSLWNVTANREVTRVELDDLRVSFGVSWDDGATEHFYEAGRELVGGSYDAKFGLFRPPDEITDFELMYYRKPQLMTADSDRPDIPDEYEDLIIQFAVNRGAMFIEDMELASATYAMVHQMRKDAAKDHQRRIKRKNWVGERRSTRIIRYGGRQLRI